MRIRLKDKKEKDLRQARYPGSAKVFSYYASRSPGGDMPTGRKPDGRQKNWRTLSLRSLPLIIAYSAIAVSLGYLLWLDTMPRVEIITSSSTAKGTIAQTEDTYEKFGQELLKKSFLNRFKITADTDRLADEFKMHFPEIKEVAVTTPLAGHKLIFEIQPAKPSLALVQRQKPGYVILDERGRALLKTNDDSTVKNLGVDIITDDSGIDLKTGDYVLTADNVNFITEVLSQLKAKNITVQSINLPPVPNELHIRPAGVNYYVKFNIVGDARLQTGSFLAAKEWMDRERLAPAQYVDVRTEEKVFYQ